MNYICVFTLIFLGILGTVSCFTALGEAFTYSEVKCSPIVVRYCGAAQLESRVRALLKATKGDIIILIPENTDKDSEYLIIAKMLAKENSRIIIKQKRKYLRKKGGC